MSIDRADLTARARIRDAAFRLFAERGSEATSFRQIAELADVSPGLITHHFGTKDALVAEVDTWVTQRIEEVFRRPPLRGSPAEAATERREQFDQLLLELPELADYLRRSVLEPSPHGVEWFSGQVARTAQSLRHLEEAGMARHSDDVEIEAALLVLIVFGPVILRPVLEGALGTELRSPEALARWRAGELELLTSALYPNGRADPAP
ncbi:MAG: helix-turn-helix domain-containing protein [Ilumatobacteraceae bacterium]